MPCLEERGAAGGNNFKNWGSGENSPNFLFFDILMKFPRFLSFGLFRGPLFGLLLGLPLRIVEEGQ